jgi:hypothetical protein
MTVLPVYFNTVTLPANGTYTILVDALGAATGSVTLALHNDVTGTVTVNGNAATVAIGRAGQNGSYTFSGKNGTQVTVRIDANSFGDVTIRLLRPDGTVMTSASASTASFILPTQSITITGTYRIEIDPSLGNTGSLQLRVTSP